MANQLTSHKPAGYDALIAKFGLKALPNWHHSAVSRGVQRQFHSEDGQAFEVYPASFMPEDTLGDHLEFALKYDGTNPEILGVLFDKVSPEEILAYIQTKPTGKYARRIWYLYETLTGRRLALDDLKMGNYVDLLDPEEYYTGFAAAAKRQRVNDNLLGTLKFCPVVRRTEQLRGFEAKNLTQQCHDLIASVPPDILKRALSYLYKKETKSSFEIENVTLDTTRTERFVNLLILAEKQDFFRKPDLIELQNRVVDARFRDSDYRKNQNYVGESVSLGQERVHFVSPKPTDLEDLMNGMFAAHSRMSKEKVQPVVHAAVIAFGFVFMHPFEDGNGRIHRFLIHNILARQGFTPHGVIFPVSAVMLQDRQAYDAALEAFSKQLLPLIDYQIDREGRLTVKNETARHYRYMDLTVQAEALFEFIERVIQTDLVAELNFLRNYDAAKAAIQSIVDLPDRLIDLFIRLCLQNNGVLSAAKRKSHFDMLTEDELNGMEKAVREIYLAK
jgi:fido (protein-threonine AMPylation protein)